LRDRKGVLKTYLADAKANGQINRDLLRAGLNFRMEELRIAKTKVREELNQAYAQRQGLLVALDTIKVGETMVNAAARGRKPQFLEQFEGLKRAGVELPVLCRSLRPEDVVAGRETERATNSFEDLNRKIMSTLKAFQGSKTDDDVFEVHRYFRTITDATTSTTDAVQKQAAEQAVRKQLEHKSVQEYLLAQNIRHSGNAGEAVTASTLKQTLKVTAQAATLA